MRPKIKEKAEAIILRKEGKTLNEIVDLLKISKASASKWVQEVHLDEEVLEQIKRNGIKKRAIDNIFYYRNKRLEFRKIGQSKDLLKDPIYLSGCMLYWAEGRKDRVRFEFTNSDPEMMKFFYYEFLTKYFNIDKSRIRISILHYENDEEKQDKNEVKDFWLNLLSLQENNFGYYETRITKGQIRNKYGVCRIQISSVEIVQQIYGTLSKIAHFSEEKWLN